MIRHLLLSLFVLALSAGPAAAQANAPAPLAAAQAAEARLDFRTALAAYAARIAEAPDDQAAYLARAALHRRMNRPALALDDLATALDKAPGSPEVLVARGELHLALNALSRAVADFDAALEAAPDTLAALVGRARARTRSGLTTLALSDYDRALALVPDNAALAAERMTLVTARATPDPTALRYDPTALMAPEYRVEEGAANAPAELVIVHAGNDLAGETRVLPRAAYASALADGVLRTVHLFTYSGDDSAIWANLALICAGPGGYATVSAALAGEGAREALDDIDAGRGRSAFETLVAGAYAKAGLAPPDDACAFSRGKALGYLSDWSEKREADRWRGATIYDTWPVFILDGAVIPPVEIAARLAALTAPEATPDPVQAAPRPAAPVVPGPGPAAPDIARAMAPDLPAAARRPPAAPPAPANLGPVDLGPVDESARVPAELRGVWAPTLPDCIAYTDRIAAPQTLDIALPAPNPDDGPALGTVLLTSRGLMLFDAAGSTCDLLTVDDGDGTTWRARFACAGRTAAMTLIRTEAEGPAPRLIAEGDGQDPAELLQCRPLGALGRDFAGLWQIDDTACRARAPVGGATFDFLAAGGDLRLTVTPDMAPAQDNVPPLGIGVDGAALGAAGPWGGTNWTVSLAGFDAAAERLGRGLLLVARAGPADGGAVWTRTLPLLGSGQAMAALAACAQPR